MNINQPCHKKFKCRIHLRKVDWMRMRIISRKIYGDACETVFLLQGIQRRCVQARRSTTRAKLEVQGAALQNILCQKDDGQTTILEY